MDSAQNQLADKIKTTNNVLISVSRDPSVDQLAAMLGLALALNKTGRHAAAVFSGKIPSTLEFLQPEHTFEKNTDSLRDFIIALDKAKADKLRYKVEDDLVRIFITPYKTSLSDADLAFSQGDFNVDLVIALGVNKQEDLDEAITAHGRILHDATVTSITVSDGQGEQLGSINWHEQHASSLSELVTELVQIIDPNLVDGQIATALLTGIVSETERFSNDKTSAQTMSMSALLMAAGANQQLVASKLDEPEPEEEHPEPEDTSEDDQDEEGDTPTDSDDDQPEPPKPNDGIFEISHDDEPAPEDEAAPTEATPEEPAVVEVTPEATPEVEQESASETEAPVPEITTEPAFTLPEPPAAPESDVTGGSRIITEPPMLGGQLTANSSPETLEPSSDPMSVPSSNDQQLLTRSDNSTNFTPPPSDWTTPAPVDPGSAPDPLIPAPAQPAETTLSALENAVIPDVPEPAVPQPEVSDAREEVNKVLSSEAAQQPLGAIEALNAQPLGDSLHPVDAPQQPATQYTSVEDLLAAPATPAPEAVTPPANPQVFDPTAPPPVPPPMFNFGQNPDGTTPPKQ